MTRSILLLASLGTFSIACNEYALVEEDKSATATLDEENPDIEVDPMELDFGDVYVDGVEAPPASVTEIVTIRNVGGGPLQIQEIYLADTTSPYEIGALNTPVIQPEGTATFTVTFHPETAGPTTSAVLIESNDPDESTVEVALLGQGVAPDIEVSPTEYDFGTLYIGCDGEQMITISNVGNAPLLVSNLQMNTGSTDFDFIIEDAILGEILDGGLSIEPGASQDVVVSYAPYDDYADIAYLVVTSNDPYTPQVTAVQEGLGELYGSARDIYEQPVRGMTDILFAVDRSCSMDDDIINVQNNFGTFTTVMSGLDADYHVAATVEDDGCINGSDLYIDNTFSASDAQNTITTMINLGGVYGSNTERPLMLLETTLSESLDSSGCNWGLIREDATLNLIGVSDEPEQSVNPYSYYVSLFQSLKANPDDVVLHAIGGDYPTGCGSASAFTGFYEATVATGGIFLSICATDWGAHLEALAEGSAADLSSFALTDYPVEETIEVRVDGISTTIGWEYNGLTNAIDFESDYVPEGGSTIEIDYALFGDCDA